MNPTIRHIFLNRLGGYSILTPDGITGNFGTIADAASIAALDPGVKAVLMLGFDTAFLRGHAFLAQSEEATRAGDHRRAFVLDAWADQLHDAANALRRRLPAAFRGKETISASAPSAEKS